jgi:hypothetical protein
MPQDAIQRWEWEGGATVVDASAAEDEKRDQLSGRMDESSAREGQDAAAGSLSPAPTTR